MFATLKIITKDVGLLTIALTLALTANFAYGQWSNPTGTPPDNNTLPPINIGATNQVKTGGLSTGALSVVGNQALNGELRITSTAPTIKYFDTDGIDFWTRANNNKFYIFADRNDDGAWGGDGSPALELNTTAVTDGSGDWARFAGQVRAREYCDINGNNCGFFGSTENGRVLKVKSVNPTAASLASVSAARSYWNNIITTTDNAGSTALRESNFAEDCRWYNNETHPTSANGYGGDTRAERLDSCGTQVCRHHPTYGQGGVLITQTSHCGEGSSTCAMGAFYINCLY